MTYDQWKTTPPEEQYGVLCECGNPRPLLCEHCDECADEMIAEDAMQQFYQWEPA